MIETAKNRIKNAEFYLMDTSKLEFNNNFFDGIWANAIFCHIPKRDILKVLKKIFKLMKEKGILYLSVKEGKGEILKPDARYNNVQKYYSFFQKKEIEAELKKDGFNIIESYIQKQEIFDNANSWINTYYTTSLFDWWSETI